MNKNISYCFVVFITCLFFLVHSGFADEILEGIIESGTYKSEDNVILRNNAEIQSGSDVTLIGGRSVRMLPNTHIQSGSRVAVIADDGLPDSWEMQYFGHTNWAAQDDPDEDGYSNYVEYNLGTDPNSGTSVPDPDDYDEGVDYGFSVIDQQGGDGILGETVNILNGNVIEVRDDLRFASPNSLGLSFWAYYNSRPTRVSELGYGWTHTYSAVLETDFGTQSGDFIRIVDETGRLRYFLQGTAGEFDGFFDENSKVKLEGTNYVWYRLDGSKYGFALDGKLSWIDDEKSNRLNISYDIQDRLDMITDTASGRSLTFNYNASNLLETLTGPVTDAVSTGIWVTYGYDGNQNLTLVLYADNSGFDYEYTNFDDINNLTRKLNKAGHEINTWDYDAQDRSDYNFSRDGRGLNLITYVSDTQVDVKDAYDITRTYTIAEFDGRKRLTAMTGTALPPYSDHNAIRWEYDDNLNLREIEYSGGTVNQYQDFDDRGNPQTVILAAATPSLPETRTIYYTYHPEMNTVLTRTEATVLGTGNKVTTWDYDDDGGAAPPNQNPTRLIYRIVEQGNTYDALETIIPYTYVTKFTYNGKGQVESIDQPRSGTADTTYFGYDPTTGDLLSITRPLIGLTQFPNYDAAGQAGYVIDVNNQTTRFTYDGKGHITTITYDADSSSRSVLYNTAGLPETTTDEDGVNFDYIYETAHGRLDQIVDMDNNYIKYGYDDQGNRKEKSKYTAGSAPPADPPTFRRRWGYQHPNYPGQLWKEINDNDTYTEYGYDAAGNITSVKNPENHTTTYGYDALNRLETVTQPETIITRYDYNSHDDLIKVTDANDNITTYTYDDMGWVVKIVSPDTGVTTFAYDEVGNIIQKRDANGNTIVYLYDDLNRLTNVNFPDPTQQNVTYTYDERTNGNGHRTGVSDQSGTISLDYDVRGRLTAKTSLISSQPYSLTRVFTRGGRLDLVTYPSGQTIDYDRFNNGKINTVTTTQTILLNSISYNPFGSPTGLGTGSGGTVENEYNKDGNLETINPGQPMEQEYTYYDDGNLWTIRGTNKPWYDQDFVYDDPNRLTNATGVYGTIGYTYDDVGNRLTRTVGSQTENYTYVLGTNKISQITGAGDPVVYTYDDNGNVSGIGNWTLVYNQNNRLIRVEEDSNAIGEYTYNGLGQRVIKTAGGVTTLFHYDFDGNIIAESDLSANFTYEYLYVDQVRMAMVDDSGNIYYFSNNYLGTPVIMTDDTNMLVWDADYKPFGEAEINTKSEVVNNFRFPGQYYDKETGLHYNYLRYYNPKTGRYLTPDPIGFIGGINLYLYVNGNPVNAIDLLGLFDKDEALKILMSTPTGKKIAETMIEKNTEIIQLTNEIRRKRGLKPTTGGFHNRNLVGIDPRSDFSSSSLNYEAAALLAHEGIHVMKYFSGKKYKTDCEKLFQELDAFTNQALVIIELKRMYREYMYGGDWFSMNVLLRYRTKTLEKHIIKEYELKVKDISDCCK
jgi:RHS repeat-associated protein